MNWIFLCGRVVILFPISQEKINHKKDLHRAYHYHLRAQFTEICVGILEMFSNAFTNLWQGQHSCLCNQSFTLILIHSCFALLCTLFPTECNINQVTFVLPWWKTAGRNCACWEGFCEHRHLLDQVGLLFYLFWEGETAACHQLQDCLLWPAFMEAVHRLFSCPSCTPSAMLWTSTYEHVKIQSLLFTR